MKRAWRGVILVYICVASASLASAQSSSQFTIGVDVFGADTTPPSVPANVSNTVFSSIPQVTVSWDASTDAESGVAFYNIFRDTLFLASTTATSYADLSVSVGNTYVYRVSAVDNASNESSQSASTTAVVNPGGGGGDTTPPTTPQNLIALVSTSGPSVSLSWNASTDASGIAFYRIYRDGALINTSVVTSYVDFNVATGTTYLYRVSAVDTSNNESSQSNVAEAIIPSGETPDTTPPSLPTNLFAVVLAGPMVSLSWNPSSDAQTGVAFYRMYRDGAFIGSTTTITFFDATVSVGTSYSYRVSAVDGAGNESAQSSEVIVTIPVPDTTPPSVPQNLVAVVNTTPAVLLSWTASTDADSGIAFYRVYRNSLLLTTVVGTTYLDAAVSAGASYVYRVSAVDGAGNESAQSNQATADIPEAPLAPPDPTPPEDPDASSPTTPDTGGGIVPPPGFPAVPTTPTDVQTDDIDIEIPSLLAPVSAFIEDISQRASSLIENVSERANAVIARMTESPEQQRVITVGTAVTGLLIPLLELSVVPLSSGSTFWYALLARFRDIGQFFSWLFSWTGIRKRRRPWGTVYDSVTKQPLDPAYVELLNAETGESVGSAITDLDGRYGFSPPPGRYKMLALKTNYHFPSKRVFGKTEDIIYNNLYFGGEVTVGKETIIAQDIPMDPESFDWNEFEKRRLGVMKFYSRWGLIIHILTASLFYVGLLLSVGIMYFSPSAVNVGVVVAYLLIMLLRKLFMKPLAKGRVTDSADGAPLSYASVNVYIPGKLDRPIKKVVTDAFGRYYCLIPKGNYVVIIEEQQSDGSFIPIFQSDIIHVRRGVLDTLFRI